MIMMVLAFSSALKESLVADKQPFPTVCLTISSRPGSIIGDLPLLTISTVSLLISTPTTFKPLLPEEHLGPHVA